MLLFILLGFESSLTKSSKIHSNQPSSTKLISYSIQLKTLLKLSFQVYIFQANWPTGLAGPSLTIMVEIQGKLGVWRVVVVGNEPRYHPIPFFPPTCMSPSAVGVWQDKHTHTHTNIYIYIYIYIKPLNQQRLQIDVVSSSIDFLFSCYPKKTSTPIMNSISSQGVV